MLIHRKSKAYAKAVFLAWLLNVISLQGGVVQAAQTSPDAALYGLSNALRAHLADRYKQQSQQVSRDLQLYQKQSCGLFGGPDLDTRGVQGGSEYRYKNEYSCSFEARVIDPVSGELLTVPKGVKANFHVLSYYNTATKQSIQYLVVTPDSKNSYGPFQPFGATASAVCADNPFETSGKITCTSYSRQASAPPIQIFNAGQAPKVSGAVGSIFNATGTKGTLKYAIGTLAFFSGQRLSNSNFLPVAAGQSASRNSIRASEDTRNSAIVGKDVRTLPERRTYTVNGNEGVGSISGARSPKARIQNSARPSLGNINPEVQGVVTGIGTRIDVVSPRKNQVVKGDEQVRVKAKGSVPAGQECCLEQYAFWHKHVNEPGPSHWFFLPDLNPNDRILSDGHILSRANLAAKLGAWAKSMSHPFEKDLITKSRNGGYKKELANGRWRVRVIPVPKNEADYRQETNVPTSPWTEFCIEGLDGEVNAKTCVAGNASPINPGVINPIVVNPITPVAPKSSEERGGASRDRSTREGLRRKPIDRSEVRSPSGNRGSISQPARSDDGVDGSSRQR